MDIFSLTLDSFSISNTRSRHTDTDTVIFGMRLGARQFPLSTYHAGDLNNGNYATPLKAGPILVTDGSLPLALTYQIYNGDVGALSSQLNQLATTLLTGRAQIALTPTGLGLTPPNLSSAANSVATGLQLSSLLVNTSGWYAAVLKQIAVTAINFAFPDCDGFVVADAVGLTISNWDDAITNAGGARFSATMPYAGTDSPSGCGSNSQYNVTWSITRSHVTGSLRQALAANHLSGANGLRALSTG
jgi:hypothetical protein